MLLKDKVALITGAGIGRASAIRFAEEGATVLVADLRPESAANTASEISRTGGSAKSIAVDVRIGAEVERMVNETMHAFGRSDIFTMRALRAPGPSSIRPKRSRTGRRRVLKARVSLNASMRFRK